MGRIGIEWVLQYHGTNNCLDAINTKLNAEGFYNTLTATQHFAWGDDLAWDQDFERQNQGHPPAGTDDVWANSVDMMYFAGHGTPDAFFFGVTFDDARAKPSEIRWGAGRLKWIALNACEVLFHSDRPGDQSIFDRWGWPVFEGLHYILGFHTIALDEPDRGRIFAQYLNAGNTVRQAWVKACQDTEDCTTKWAYLRADAEGISTYADHWLGKGPVSGNPCPPSVLYYVRGSC